jgi:hypothetical protein
LSVALDDVGGNRKGSPSQLATKRNKLSAAYPQRRAMDIERECVCLPPNLEFLEITHSQRKRHHTRMATSFRLEGNPMRRELQQENRRVWSERSD